MICTFERNTFFMGRLRLVSLFYLFCQRGPRYFDTLDSGWSNCYNCGEEGHMAVNCPTFTKKIKPCFVCGSLEHGAKQCTKVCEDLTIQKLVTCYLSMTFIV